MNLINIAELCGIILGDGNLHKTENRITITGSLDDKHYFEDYVIPIFKNIFPEVNPSLNKVKSKKAYRVVVENKKMFQCITRQVGLERGNKKNAKVPEFIFRNKIYMQCFLRGLYDTDGSLKFSKQSGIINCYPRIQFSNQEGIFAYQIGEILTIFGFPFGK